MAYIGKWVLGVACLSGLAGLPARGVTIDHSNFAAATSTAMSVMSKVGQLRWFFTHASVGANIVTGMNDLHGTDTNRYRLTIYSVGTAGGGANYRASTNPVSTSNGVIYECDRGNPGWANKLVCFSNSLVTSGWRFPKVNVAMDKFCWIDPDADSTNYCTLISQLEVRYPETLFIYLTMPLSGLSFDQNDERNSFNRYVRSFCAANSKHLFDVADLEAWNQAGVQQTYVSGGVTNQKMSFDYSEDTSSDWHLNATGRRRMALAWYSLAAALFAEDRDSDGSSDGDELLAGTEPANPDSTLEVHIAPQAFAGSGSNMVVSWVASTSRYYSIQRAVELAGSPVWSNRLADSLGANAFTDAVGAAPQHFYRLSARQ
ncbi:MAG: hypothetical protein KKC51_14790 [Verrucomicrobia bacterium]|nr:hypothetical protein [Verrucomicrobiota bacterium]